MKKLYIEILLILTMSVLLALGFNFYRSKPLPLIYKETKIEEISESELFGDENLIVNKTDSTNNETQEKFPEFKVDKQEPIEKVETEKVNNDLATNNSTTDDSKEHINLTKTVTYNQMLKILKDDSFFIIDARSSENYKKAHIGNAINIFPYDDEAVIMPKIFDLPHDKKIVIYCDGGQCDSSHELAKMILNFGYKNIYLYAGGWEEWSKKNGN